jgi:hypothetical protein
MLFSSKRRKNAVPSKALDGYYASADLTQPWDPNTTSFFPTTAWIRVKWNASPTSWVSGSNGAENRFKGYESSKPDQKYLFPAHFTLITSPFILSESNLFTSPEICKQLKIRILISDHFLM